VRGAQKASRACGALLALIGLLACEPDPHHGWVLANRRDHPLELWLRRTPFCAHEANLSIESNFGPVEHMTMRAQDYIFLRELQEPHEQSAPCGAVWLAVPGEFEVVLAWGGEPTWSTDDDPIPFSVIVEGPREHLVLHVPAGVEELPAPASP
jgi:hypothetical protein